MTALFERRLYFEALIRSNIYSGFITCPSYLEAVNVRVPFINFGL
jgi:hypothetical protein